MASNAVTDEEKRREAFTMSDIAYSEVKIQEYLKSGEISSKLSLDASLAVIHANSNWDRIVPAYAEMGRKWIHVYREVAASMAEVQLKMKEFEFKHWMGFCDEDVKELVELYREHENFDWKSATEERRQFMRDLWDPMDFDDKKPLWKKHWLKYHKRRVRKPLQALKGEFCSTDGDVLERLARLDGDTRAAMESLKVMTGGSAGRVLLTIEDRYPQGDPKSIYGGAHITLIFDESAQWPRGGVQGHCATKDEAIRLIQACIDYMPSLFADKTLRIC
jgi:hypothetical protein